MSAPEHKSAGGPLASILALPNDDPKKTLFVAIAVCLVCSVVVAAAAIGLRPLQAANQERDRIRNIVEVAGVGKPGQSAAEAFRENVEPILIRLSDGSQSDALDPATFDIAKVSKDPALSRAMPKADDHAGIKRQPHFMPVYVVRTESGGIKTLILPVHGAGLWSTLYGFLALEGDLRTVGGLKFYQHAETPGLGGEVDNLNWRAIWNGKIAFDDTGRPGIQLVKGGVDHSVAGNESRIDGLAGATLTSRGVEKLINFWLGEAGYGPLIERLRSGRS
ncbi:MAG: Na(+)-translocating NADH-quinone reductase subunit C [Rhodocyclaceae bacterium]|jgi:Na+-transporting NADH:ubiquinone oxidoreductase subunit C|nr:Na(+)-translocating NADH-quinone reductase subunit C [Rhodocyclaceae bacterium]MCL4757252.1 Na(+)-translocating NADH-quinone reductase subunit C [Rhodocyclaceae bacterium]